MTYLSKLAAVLFFSTFSLTAFSHSELVAPGDLPGEYKASIYIFGFQLGANFNVNQDSSFTFGFSDTTCEGAYEFEGQELHGFADCEGNYPLEQAEFKIDFTGVDMVDFRTGKKFKASIYVNHEDLPGYISGRHRATIQKVSPLEPAKPSLMMLYMLPRLLKLI